MSACREALEAALSAGGSFNEQTVLVLDEAVKALYGNSEANRHEVHGVLTTLQDHPDAWRLVQTILVYSREETTRFFALSILQKAVKTRWQLVPPEERRLIPEYLIRLSVAAACTPNPSAAICTKLNEVIVEVARRTWPEEWPTFIPDLCLAAQSDQKICENNLNILNLFSEEILEFGSEQMTYRKSLKMISRLGVEFKSIFDLCLFVLTRYHESPQSVTPSLIQTTLKCLASFIKHNEADYIFTTGLENFLLDHFWEPIDYRLACIKCFTEMFSRVNLSEKSMEQLTYSWTKFLRSVANLPPQSLEYDTKFPVGARLFWETLYQHVTLAITQFCKLHFKAVCEAQNPGAVRMFDQLRIDPKDIGRETLQMMVKLSELPNEETFKICLEFWHNLAEDLYEDCASEENKSKCKTVSESVRTSRRLNFYQEQLNSVRSVIISRMARPPEVYVKYDEDSGTVERDYQLDTDELALYSLMRQTLVLLTHLSETETERIMLSVLHTFTEAVQRYGTQKEWNPAVLNRLCWSIGSISGAMTASRERSFLVQVLKSLLWFCEVKRGKENKAIVAAMIMYVNGQYPRFLKSNENLLKVVVSKNFEFMGEIFPGVQDMACETFYKLAIGCKENLAAQTDLSTGKRLLVQMIERIPELTKCLQTLKQCLLVYHAVAIIVNACRGDEKGVFLDGIVQGLNPEWTSVLTRNQQTPVITELPIQTVRRVTEILQINERMAQALGAAYDRQFVLLFFDMLSLYNTYGSHFRNLHMQGLENQLNHALPREMRSARRSMIRLVETFIRQAAAGDHRIRVTVVNSILPPLLLTVYGDYRESPPAIRDAEVILLGSAILQKLSAEVEPHFVDLFGSIFSPTLEMINTSYDTFPEIRLAFYEFMETVVTKCYENFIRLPDREVLNLAVKGLIFGIQDEKPDVAAIALRSTLALLRTTRKGGTAIQAFASMFYMDILRPTVGVLTDTLHTSGRNDQKELLRELTLWADAPQLNVPDSPLQKTKIMESMQSMLISAFSNLNRSQIDIFVLKAFSTAESYPNEFNQNVEDLLVQLREFGGSEELFAAERQEAIDFAQSRKQRLAMVPGYTQPEIVCENSVEP